MKKVKAVFVSLCIVFGGLLSVPAYASSTSSTVSCPADLPNREIICGKGGEQDMISTVGKVLTAVYGMVGILAVVMIIVGGVKYMTSEGDPGKIQSAKNTIMYSVIGLVITLLAFAITNFILGALGG